MNVKTIIGLVLVIGGVLLLVYRGIPYTTDEEIVNFGPLHATAHTDKTLPVHPVIGAAVLIGGIALVVLGAKRNSK